MTGRNDLMNERTSYTPTTLLRRASGDDQTAWSELVVRYSRRVFEHAYRVLRDRHDAEDIMQQVFADAARYLARKPQRTKSSSFRGWLRCVTKRRIIDLQRKRLRVASRSVGGTTNAEVLKQLSSSDEGSSQHTLSSLGDVEQAAVDRVRARCRGKSWDLFQAVVCDGRRPVDVARDFGVTLNDVYLARSRVSRRLRDELSHAESETAK